jgi:hypothetical protein
MRSHWIRVELKYHDCCLNKRKERGIRIQRYSEARRPWEDGGTDWSDNSYRPRNIGITRVSRGWEESPERAWPY